jgi:hypothetical protein
LSAAPASEPVRCLSSSPACPPARLPCSLQRQRPAGQCVHPAYRRAEGGCWCGAPTPLAFVCVCVCGIRVEGEACENPLGCGHPACQPAFCLRGDSSPDSLCCAVTCCDVMWHAVMLPRRRPTATLARTAAGRCSPQPQASLARASLVGAERPGDASGKGTHGTGGRPCGHVAMRPGW